MPLIDVHTLHIVSGTSPLTGLYCNVSSSYLRQFCPCALATGGLSGNCIATPGRRGAIVVVTGTVGICASRGVVTDKNGGSSSGAVVAGMVGAA